MKKIFPAVIGLGYVGLPIFLRLNKKFKTIGYDINKYRIDNLQKKKDLNKEFDPKNLSLKNKSFFSNKSSDLEKSNFFIITVPTPIYSNNTPDLRNLINVSHALKTILKKGDVIFFESTVYPGVTENICAKILEKGSKLKCNKDFFVGYSPERINPGDNDHTIEKIDKVIAIKKAKQLNAKHVYKHLAKRLIFTESIKEAEASKVIENIQRDLNIGLMNEIYQVCNKSNINFNKVIELAKSKWNFINYQPGLVGGHCLPVDPYYFSWFAKKKGLDTKIILAGRKTNNRMVKFAVKEIIKKIKNKKKQFNKIKVLIMGLTYKKNVADLRNSLSVKVYDNIKKKFKKVCCYDPMISNNYEKKFSLIDKTDLKSFDVYIVLTKHDSFKKILTSLKGKFIIDIFS
tara:strand:- start:1084 stop:2286 length:1203 start_codon:yes stop_codon:yes gene_type:complete